MYKKNVFNGRVTLVNMISSLILQFVTIISGFIIPKLIIDTFGSNINGLISSINQFLNYITLLEGGVSGIIVANLYKPLVEKNEEKINIILKTADKFYKKVGIIFVIYAIIIAIIYPLAFNTHFSYIYVFSLIIILAMNLFIQYMFSLTLKTLLNADKKVYVISTVQVIIVVLNVLVSIAIIKIFPRVHLLKLLNGLIYLIQPIAFTLYVRKKYNVNLNVKKNNELIAQRWNGFAVNIASFVHNCTDITILTIFTNLSLVSVYSIYSLVTTGLKQLINAVTNGINPTIGQTYVKGEFKELYIKMDLYELIVNFLVFLLFSVTAILITPFILIYTSGVNDANYNQLLFGILLVISEGIYLLKIPHLNLAYAANKFKELTIPAFLEAFINIVISIALVYKLGIIGVTIGTIIAMTYRLVFQVRYTKKLIGRNKWFFYKKITIFALSSLIGISICIFFLPLTELTVTSWLIHAIIYTTIIGSILFITSYMFFKNEINYFIQYIKKNKIEYSKQTVL